MPVSDVTMVSATETPAEPLDRLAPLIGRWRTTGREWDATGTEVRTIDGTDAYEWMEGGRWVVHRVDVRLGDETTRALEMIGTAVEREVDYVLRAFDGGGAFDMMRARWDDDALRIDGDGVRATFRLPGTGGQGDDAMEARWERQFEGGDWWPWMELRFRRLRDGEARGDQS